MMKRILFISLILILLIAILTVNQVFGASVLKPAKNGEIKAVSVSIYSDRSCKNPLTSIDWGFLNPGSTKNINIYVKNTGNTVVTLSLSTENWNPEYASKYFSLTWNYKGQKLLPGKVLGLTLTLSISPNISEVSRFNFDIIIAGIEVP